MKKSGKVSDLFEKKVNEKKIPIEYSMNKDLLSRIKKANALLDDLAFELENLIPEELQVGDDPVSDIAGAQGIVHQVIATWGNWFDVVGDTK